MSTAVFTLDVRAESWPLKRAFKISRGSMDQAHVVTVTLRAGDLTGRGEAVPSRRYNQSIESVRTQIESLKDRTPFTRAELNEMLPPGAARNAVDCALWDLEAKRSGQRVWELARISVLSQVQTSFTISLDTPAAMGAAARLSARAPILKVKLGGDEPDIDRVKEVRDSAPAARLFIDANESWSVAHYQKIVPQLADLGVELVEQPFPAADDAVLDSLDRPVPVCADESCHTTTDLVRLVGRYEAINIKLDKTGGLTEALEMSRRARAAGLKLLFGCMVCTSLGIAPARILASPSDLVDLDGPLLLAKDRDHGLQYAHGRLALPESELWG